MAKHPTQNEHLLFIEDYDIENTDQSVGIIDTTLPNSQLRSQSTFEYDAFIDTFVSETKVHQFFEFDKSTAGGPPGVLSAYDCIVESPRRKFSKGDQTNEK